jgi:5-methylcytosine-specific restriction endonuclease McrA
MPLKDIVERNKYMNKYMTKRYHRRRLELIERLGGKCVRCGTPENLDLDHIDPKLKVINWKYLSGLSKEKLESEIIKCQLLCKSCHIEKTVKERGQEFAKGKHGTISAYRYCGPPKCDECKNIKRFYNLKLNRGSVA